MGRPKALMFDAHGVSYLERATSALLEGGCSGVTVVLGAAAEQVKRNVIVPAPMPRVTFVVNQGWADGMGSSVRFGLKTLGDATAAVVMLVDLPDVTAAVVHRLIAHAGPEVIARATYQERPGHPVVIGRAHWRPIVDTGADTHGARAYLDQHGVLRIPCDDLATGRDIDRPEDLIV